MTGTCAVPTSTDSQQEATMTGCEMMHDEQVAGWKEAWRVE